MSRIEDALANANKLRQLKEAEARGTERPPSPPPTPHKVKRGWMYGVGIPLALAAVFGLYLIAAELKRQTGQTKQMTVKAANSQLAVQQTTEAAPRPQNNSLPSCIPLNSPDETYASKHPGWESYKNRMMEFRVFREKSAVKAIQVISRQEKAISDGFFASFLREIAGTDSFNILSGKKKDGYYIEKGSADGVAEIIVYRKKPAGEIKAVVVAYR